MKRSFMFGGEGEVDSSINMANVLMLLAHGGGGDDKNNGFSGRMFECKTCNRQFTSFQALGGHRASHKKPRLVHGDVNGHAGQEAMQSKPRVHECSVCGLEFAIGQALGGHMRRHRAEGEQVVKGSKRSKRVVMPWLDLNLPPLEERMDMKLLDSSTSIYGGLLPVVICHDL